MNRNQNLFRKAGIDRGISHHREMSVSALTVFGQRDEYHHAFPGNAISTSTLDGSFVKINPCQPFHTMKKQQILARFNSLLMGGLMILACCLIPCGISAQSDNLTSAPVGQQWVDATTAEATATAELTTLEAELANLQNAGTQGVQLELVKARIQFYKDLIQNLKAGNPVYRAFAMGHANNESTFLGDYLDVKVLNEAHLLQIREDVRKKLTI